MTARTRMLALAVALAACSGGSNDPTGPGPGPGPEQPGPEPGVPGPGTPAPEEPAQSPGVQGNYVLERINQSEPGQLVTIANPDGLVIGLYRFEATVLTMDALQTFALALRYTDDKTQFVLDDAGEFKQAGPISQGALPLTFSSDVYGDAFTGVALEDIVTINYDFDGDGQLDTSFAFRRAD
jgi:hypothetical protein